MSEGIGYALGAMLLYGLADYVYKRGASAGAPPHQFLMVQTWFFSSLALLYGLVRSEEHTSELQSQSNLVCRLLLEKKKHAPYLMTADYDHAAGHCHTVC